MRSDGGARDLGLKAGPAAGGAVDAQRAVERGDAVGQAAQAGAARRVSAPPMPSSRDLHGDAAPLRRRTATLACVASAYFATFASASETTK